MRCPPSEKLEIIRLVERSHLPVRRTLDKLGIPTTTFYRWYDRYGAFDEAGLEDRNCGPGRVWNRIPDDIRGQIVELALDEPELSPRELAVTVTDAKGYFRKRPSTACSRPTTTSFSSISSNPQSRWHIAGLFHRFRNILCPIQDDCRTRSCKDDYGIHRQVPIRAISVGDFKSLEVPETK